MKLLSINILALVFTVLAACSATGDENRPPGKDGEGQALIFFEKTEHDLGRILQGETVGYNFLFRNEGEAPLIVQEARAGCGCTVPKFSNEPVQQGESGSIEVKFDSSGREGKQKKSVTILSNAREGTIKLTLTADIYRQEF